MSHDLWEKRRRVADHLERQVARTTRQAPAHPNDSRAIAKLPGDPLSLRGIPLMSRGVPAVMPHTSPLAALMAKQPRDD